MIATTGLEVDQLLKIGKIMINPDPELLPSGNAKGAFGYFWASKPKVTRSQSAALRNDFELKQTQT
ncbi:MAG: hypothetical protein L3J46_04935 [Kangiellaceae bacterium]|nr:hypothetical protein [Kangiellaceae bacterium]